jgi:predicted transcriptional regulator
MHKPKRVRVNYRLRPDIKESVEQIATDTGKTMTEIIESAVKLYAEEEAWTNLYSR